ncbi:GNAT family N-acetyltransferase [Gordonia soli]|uniref:N-acetyltransferase domain-containing protein n=1 Tax=Gordonia soli NBRC 108243 TaxID=1223545 RepID=M0QLA3_9ACTN|nr:N-acetyltransferase [Gordonia soli]GAC69420.1 hypothetical protein GS4_24_00680 [Gordonia soli NBRC 108243]
MRAFAPGGMMVDMVDRVRLRPLTAADDTLLATATLENLNWAAPRFTVADVLESPEFAKYTQLSLSRGDFGVVAEADGRAVGVAWALALSARDAGYGFVDDRTPEFSLWVHRTHRDRGIGRRLTAGLLAEATLRTCRVSLSVEAGNSRARHLYESLGFTAVPDRTADGVMLWQP